jgi:RNA polymerase sigma-70 factor (ECF subfamily)
MDTPHPSLQRLMDEAPFVRLLARTLLAEDADEVVQQTWLRAIEHGGNDVKAPRAWLGQIVRNVAMNLRRGRSRQLRHEGAARAADLVPSSAELMQYEEQRRMLIAAVDALPEHLRAIVLLRYFEGLLPHQIARKLGVSSITVRNQLRRALQLLRERLDAEHGGNRRAWLLPLVPFAAGTNGMPWAGPAMPATAWSASAGIGVLAMTMKTKLVAAIGVLLAVTGALALWATRDPVPANPEAASKVAERASVETSGLPRDAMAATSMTNATERESVNTPAVDVPRTGSLVVHLRYGDDKAPAEGVTILVGRRDDRAPAGSRRQRTDAAGVARFLALQPGRFDIATDRGSLEKHADIVAGETTALDCELAIGLHLTGIVVDTTDAPVASALIEVVPGSGGDAEWLTTSGGDGRFSVRAASRNMLVGARAEGHSASPLKHLQGRGGSQFEVRLQLGPPAGSVEGLVVDERGHAIPGAVVRIGTGWMPGDSVTGNGAPPLRALVHSDAEGRFRALGVPPGMQPVVAAAEGCAPWQGTCEVAAHLVARLRIELRAGASICGKVLTAEGEPAAEVIVEMGQPDDFARYLTFTSNDGRFELSSLPAGELLLVARGGALGKVEQRVHTEVATTSECELRLSRGLELRGRVVDETGAPIAAAQLFCRESTAAAEMGGAETDAQGCFVIANCPEGKVLVVHVYARGFESLRRTDVTPDAPLELVMRRSQPMTVRIKGVVLSPDGKPLPNVMVYALGKVDPSRNDTQLTAADGRFELGPLVPATWAVWVDGSAYPDYRSEPRQLAADAVWDLGEIRLLESCRAILTVDGDRTDLRFRVVDAADNAWGSVVEENGVLVARRIAPGPHRILVQGKAVAAQSIPFMAQAGEPTHVAVKLVPGVRQRFEIAAAALDPLPYTANLQVRRGRELLASWWVLLQASQPANAELCLPRGDFTLTVSEGERQFATAAFSVGTTEAPPLRVELR